MPQEFASLIRRFIREVEEDAEETEDLGTVPELQRLDSSSSSVSADDIRRLFEERLSSTRSATQKPNNMRGSWNEPSLVPFKHNFASKRSRESARRAFESANADADDKRKEEGEWSMARVSLFYDRGYSFERNCVLRRWESETLK